MLPDVVPPPEQPPMEQLSSLLSPDILEFCESELFQETIQNSEVASSSNCCYEEQSSFPPFGENAPATITTTTIATTAPTTTTNFSSIFEEEITENDISTHLDLTNASHFTNHRYPFSDQDQFDLAFLQNHIPNTTNMNAPTFPYTNSVLNDHGVPALGPPALPTVCEDDNPSSMPPSKFMRLNNPLSPNYSFIDPSINSYLPRSMEGSMSFNRNLFLGNDIQPHELEFQGDNGGFFCSDPPPRSYNSNELQALSNESQHLVTGGGSCITPLASEITSLESETFRVTNKLTSEERKEKIHRYLKKRDKRNFTKKIKYACRKTLADSRPRVRGRFAKNDELGENNRTNSNHEEDTDENQVVVKDEEESFESSDILAQINGVNSFKCNYPIIQSWI